MGSALQKAPSWAQSLTQTSADNVNIVILALDASGRTTLLQSLNIGKVKTEIPTIGFNIEAAHYKSLNIRSLAAGGRSRTRPLYAAYFKVADAFVFCFDSSHPERFEEVKDEIRQRAKDELLQDIPILILANKSDKENVPSTEEMIEMFDLSNCLSGRTWHLQRCCAISKEGLDEAFSWLSSHVTPVVFEKWCMDSRDLYACQATPEGADWTRLLRCIKGLQILIT